MGTSPTYALAHVFLPNLVRTRTTGTVIGVIERKEKFFFDQVWAQAHLEHVPALASAQRGGYRFGVVDLPAPREPGEAYMVGLVAKASDPASGRYFLLEQEYVLATRSTRTVISERDGARHTKHGEGPPITGNRDADVAAFVDALAALLAAKPW